MVDTFVNRILASITVRNLDNDVKKRLRLRAALHGNSMEEEARQILSAAVNDLAVPSKGLGTAIHNLLKPFGGVELDLPPRDAMREPPKFD